MKIYAPESVCRAFQEREADRVDKCFDAIEARYKDEERLLLIIKSGDYTDDDLMEYMEYAGRDYWERADWLLPMCKTERARKDIESTRKFKYHRYDDLP